MKTIKTLFAIVVLSTFFIACEADSLNDEVGIEELEILAGEDIEDVTGPVSIKSEDAEDKTGPVSIKSEDAEDKTGPVSIKSEDAEDKTGPVQ